MVQSFLAVSAGFIQLALFAQISTGFPIPSTNVPESQVLSKREEQQISKRTLEFGQFAGLAVAGTVGGGLVVAGAAKVAHDRMKKKQAETDPATGQRSATPTLEEGTAMGSVPHVAVHDADGVHGGPSASGSGPASSSSHQGPHKRSELPYVMDVEERSSIKARGLYYIDELD